jgi:transcriptional regulator with XRE-family HTH domain
MDLSQAEVAKMMGITKETLSNWERYKTYPDVMALKKLCDIYGCEMDNIFLPDELAKSE